MIAADPHAPRGRPSLASTAFLLDGLFALLLVAFFSLVASGERGGDTFFSNPLLTLPILGAAVAALAGGGVAVAALRRDRPTSRPGRFALWAVGLFVAGTAVALLVAVVAQDAAVLLAFGALLQAVILAIPLAAIYARVAQGDRPALLVIPLMIGVFVAVFCVGELIGHD